MIDDDPAFGIEMLEGALNALYQGRLSDGRSRLRQYVKATIGFQELSRRTGKIDKNLMQMLGPKGNPTAASLVAIIQACLEAQNMQAVTHLTPRPDQEAMAATA
jgi:DNA-binding phage protein